MPGYERHAGTPCWVDLKTSDVAAASTFYASVLGWRYVELEESGGYQMCFVGDAPVGAVGPGAEGDARPGWTVYLATDDADATVSAAEAGGGSVVQPPGDVGEFGRAAAVCDPGGGVVGLWQGGTHAGFQAIGAPGTPAWFEVNSREAEDVAAFFAGLFDLERRLMPEMAYWTLHAGGSPRYGVLQMTAEWGDMPSHWMTYFAVADADASAEAVRGAGGEVCHGPFDTPFGRIVVCTDPQGAVFSVVQSAG